MTVPHHPPLRDGARARLIAEMAALYLLAPLAAYALVHWAGLPLLAILAPVFALFVMLLGLDRSFAWRDLFLTGISPAHLRHIFALFALLGGGIVAFAWFVTPESFLSFPRWRPGLWLAVMALYPLVSVTAQEIMYRVFFAQRYLALFNGNRALAIGVNALLFAYSHFIFESWITFLVALAGGMLFAWRYFSSRSFWAVCLEHALYGNLIFTVGLGRYFLAGVPFG